jgi:hypothetical protein
MIIVGITLTVGTLCTRTIFGDPWYIIVQLGSSSRPLEYRTNMQR